MYTMEFPRPRAREPPHPHQPRGTGRSSFRAFVARCPSVTFALTSFDGMMIRYAPLPQNAKQSAISPSESPERRNNPFQCRWTYGLSDPAQNLFDRWAGRVPERPWRSLHRRSGAGDNPRPGEGLGGVLTRQRQSRPNTYPFRFIALSDTDYKRLNATLT